jgi:transposase
MLYAAIDIQKRTFHAAMLDIETRETSERRFGAPREELDESAMPRGGRLAAVAIEATTGWRWVWRELSARGFDVRLGDPAQAKALRGRIRRARSRRCAIRRGYARPWRRTAPDGRSDCTRCDPPLTETGSSGDTTPRTRNRSHPRKEASRTSLGRRCAR